MEDKSSAPNEGVINPEIEDSEKPANGFAQDLRVDTEELGHEAAGIGDSPTRMSARDRKPIKYDELNKGYLKDQDVMQQYSFNQNKENKLKAK